MRLENILNLVAQKLNAIAEVGDSDLVNLKFEAISALCPYAVFLEQSGQQEMIDAISRTAWVYTGNHHFMYLIGPYIATLFVKPNSPSLNRLIVLALPHLGPFYRRVLLTDSMAVMKWAAAAVEVLYTEVIGWSVVDTLLYVASEEHLRHHITVDVWKLLMNVSSLPPDLCRKKWGSSLDIDRYVRGLGDIEILKSYFLLVWSEWNVREGLDQMEISMREDFSGIGMWSHRKDLVNRLDYILGQLDRRLEYLQQHKLWINKNDIKSGQKQYGILKKALLEVDKDGMDTLTSAPSYYLFSTSSS